MVSAFSAVLRSALISVAAVAVSLTPSFAQESGPDGSVYDDLKLFGLIFENIRRNYVEEVDEGELIKAAINGMLTSLDPHSDYLPPDEYGETRMQTRGEFGGIGMEVTSEEGLVKVIAPMDDTPAFRAGIQAGDFISHIDGNSLLGLTLIEAVEKLRGPVGSEIVITVIREGKTEPFDVHIVRDAIKLTTARARMEGNSIVLRITYFSGQATANVVASLEELFEEAGGVQNIDGLVLDLRNNAGGLLSEAISVSDIFLERGEIVSTRGRVEGDSARHNAKEGDILEGLPMVVLINSGSASASEIVAGALQDHNRAIIVGTTSFGKGSVQNLTPLENGGALRLTTSRYFTPAGRSIQGLGISPDIIVEHVPTDPTETEDDETARLPSFFETDLLNSLENESMTEEERLEMEEELESLRSLEELRSMDFQLGYAIDLLRGLAIFNAE